MHEEKRFGSRAVNDRRSECSEPESGKETKRLVELDPKQQQGNGNINQNYKKAKDKIQEHIGIER